MRKINRKSDIRIEWDACKHVFDAKNMNVFIDEVHTRILSQKVSFPLLEYCAEEMYNLLPSETQLLFCDAIETLKTEGGNVILGKILQLRLPQHFNQSLEKATEYIAQATIWYVCDIIGERVFGYALLHHPQKTLLKFRELSSHPTNWVVRSLGAGGHYAIKKGLAEHETQQLFRLLLTMANTQDKEVRQGVGWAAKTTAKYHPDIITRFQAEIENKEQVANWFRKKIAIGLGRNSYVRKS